MKRIFNLCCVILNLFIATTLQAVPAKQGIHLVEQPDGTTLRIALHGDEHFHFTTTEDGYLVKQNAKGVYEYAEVTAEKVIKPIGLKAYSIDQRTAVNRQLPHHAVKAAEMFQSKDKGQKIQAEGSLKNQTYRKAKETVNTTTLASRGLVLLVEFTDKKLHVASTHSSMNDMLNGANYTYDGATGSVKKYFTDQSNGVYVPEFGVFGPITLSHEMSYYGQNDSDGNDLRPAEMINEACSIANANFDVDFSQYDSDNDGKVDFVFVIYAGYAEAQGAPEHTIWPHQWDLYSAGISASKRKYDGKYVSRYACSSELANNSGSIRDGIGTFCHEFSHVLGLPDYYDTEYGTNYDNNATPGEWSLMDGGSYNNDGKTPPNYSAYDKYYLGWITPTVLNTQSNVTLEADGATYYAITSDGTLSGATMTKDVWYLENRQQIGWDAYVPAHGMLITKVRYSKSAWTNNTVNNGIPMYYDIIEADGIVSGESSAGITFPGSRNVRSYTPVGNYALANITETSDIIQFDFMGEDNGEEPTVGDIVFHDSFEDDSEWIITDNSTSTSFKMQIATIEDVNPIEGDYYLVSGYDASAARNAWAIMRNGVSLIAGKEYTISAYVYIPGYDVADQIQFTVGRGSAISDQMKVILDVHKQYASWLLVTTKFTPTIDGAYHFGIHHCTQALDVNVIAVDEFTITGPTNNSEPPIGTALENNEFLDTEKNVRKVLENGTMYILRNGERYTIDGRKID